MLYRNAPKTGDALSILGFGCMRLPQRDGRIDEERAAALVRHAIDGGVNYIDTAWPYHGGESEPFVGRTLSGGYRERVKLATKLPAWLVQSRAEMDRFLDAQLRKLDTSRIDYYLVHSLNGVTWDKVAALGVADFLDRAKADGRIVNAGFSFHGLRDDFKRIADAYPWEFCQIQYNYLDTENQAGTRGLHLAAAKGLAIVVMEPLLGGRLANPPKPVREVLERSPVKRTSADWALQWLWNQPEVTVVLSGMSNPDQVSANLAYANRARSHSFGSADLDLIAALEQKYRDRAIIPCTKCGYCLPCPNGVNIPANFEIYNDAFLHDDTRGARFRYKMFVQERERAGACTACHICEDRCPQRIPISSWMPKIHALTYDASGQRPLSSVGRI